MPAPIPFPAAPPPLPAASADDDDDDDEVIVNHLTGFWLKKGHGGTTTKNVSAVPARPDHNVYWMFWVKKPRRKEMSCGGFELVLVVVRPVTDGAIVVDLA